MSNKKVMDEFFLFWVAQLEKHGVTAKPAQIFNCDETGWCGKEESKVKVIAPRTGPVKQRRVLTADHVTALLCVSADGKTTPPCIIYKESFPHRTYREGVPVSDTGYVNTEIFCQWFLRGFIPNCGKERPVVLLMDNHDSHISLPLIQAARANDIVLVGLPSHTTHLLQPLDVHINGPLKQKVSKICNNLGFLRPGVAISKAKLPVIISHALDQTSPSSIKEAFRLSGIFPVDRKQIPDAELVPPTIDVSLPQDTEPIRSCHACGSFIGDNPLVKRGLVPRHLWDILVPPPMPAAPIKKPSAKIVATGRVISSDDILESLKAKETEAAERKVAAETRVKEREEKRKQRLDHEAERLSKRQRREHEKREKDLERENLRRERQTFGRLADKKYTCGLCGIRARVNDEKEGVEWYGCDRAEDCKRSGWYHFSCLSESEQMSLQESLDTGSEWVCLFCSEE
ncbi:uncharacterized protein LOC128219880 [Mya arenaria]|uniref:uncharacterized protein LOC128219880 n=1 Tax=Mya arenaria TaxID=6604 RepID=UPI0022DFBB8C|nr:uncharacterized protein LOC128219880 [Mya arenaria]XP_052783980.1 uncharacterized protein LOC128219880 [Mya arenaria]XP_052783981.1 uncharacterized protein LOC128219880 [Mya arenaria]